MAMANFVIGFSAACSSNMDRILPKNNFPNGSVVSVNSVAATSRPQFVALDERKAGTRINVNQH